MKLFLGGLFFFCAGVMASPDGFAETPLIQDGPQFRHAIQDNQGRLHTVWISQDNGNSALHYQTTDVSGRLLGGPILIASSSARLRRPQIAFDGGNVAHLIWQERDTQGAGQPAAAQGTIIRYAKLSVSPAGMTAALLPQPLTLNHDQAATHPSLAVDQSGWAYVAWEVEGLDVVLTAIDPAGRIGQIRHITNHHTKTDHALPVVAVDRRGNVHVAWSTQAGNKTQLVYKAFRGRDGRVLEKEKIVYTTRGLVDQTKVVTFDQGGNVKVSWISSPGRQAGQNGRLARLGATVGSGYVLLRPGHAANANLVASVADQSIQPVPGPVWAFAADALVSPKPRLDQPDATIARVTPLAPQSFRGSRGDSSIGKIQIARMLRFSTWSAAPPSVMGGTAAAYAVSPNLPSSSTDRSAALPHSSHVVLPPHSNLFSDRPSIDSVCFNARGGELGA